VTPAGALAAARGVPERFADVRAIVADIRPPEAAAHRGRRLAWRGVSMAVAATAAAFAVVHAVPFAGALHHALREGWPWVIAAVALEAGSLAGYVTLLHGLVSSASPRLRWRDSYDIALAGAAAMRLLPTAGLGGAAVTLWALRAHGLRGRHIGERLIVFLAVQYAVFMAALVLSGVAVVTGVAAAPSGSALGVLGVVLGLAVTGAAVLLLASPSVLVRTLATLSGRPGAIGRIAGGAAAGVPVIHGALGQVLALIRRPRPVLLGALAYWLLDVAVLYAMLGAFGARPAPAVVVLAYFLGTMANLIPLPGSLSAGLVGAQVALGGPAGPVLAAVLAYRAVAIWLPAAVGLLSIQSLRRSVDRWRKETAHQNSQPEGGDVHERVPRKDTANTRVGSQSIRASAAARAAPNTIRAPCRDVIVLAYLTALAARDREQTCAAD
jgi:uncharacterized membrane protein YbhN (UPF0104 family)